MVVRVDIPRAVRASAPRRGTRAGSESAWIVAAGSSMPRPAVCLDLGMARCQPRRHDRRFFEREALEPARGFGSDSTSGFCARGLAPLARGCSKKRGHAATVQRVGAKSAGFDHRLALARADGGVPGTCCHRSFPEPFGPPADGATGVIGGPCEILGPPAPARPVRRVHLQHQQCQKGNSGDYVQYESSRVLHQ